MTDEPAAVHAFVHGRVQGVGFRFFVQRQAMARGLRGWVRNLDGGQTVEVLAEGPRAEVEALVEDLKWGPRMAFVERVDVCWPEARGRFEGFEVRG